MVSKNWERFSFNAKPYWFASSHAYDLLGETPRRIKLKSSKVTTPSTEGRCCPRQRRCDQYYTLLSLSLSVPLSSSTLHAPTVTLLDLSLFPSPATLPTLRPTLVRCYLPRASTRLPPFADSPLSLSNPASLFHP